MNDRPCAPKAAVNPAVTIAAATTRPALRYDMRTPAARLRARARDERLARAGSLPGGLASLVPDHAAPGLNDHRSGVAALWTTVLPSPPGGGEGLLEGCQARVGRGTFTCTGGRVRLDPRPFQEGLELPAPTRMPQLAQRLRLDLADALAGDGEVLAHFLQRVLRAVAQAEAHLDDLLLARRERLEERLGLLLQVDVDNRLGRRDHVAVLDEVAQMRILLLADRRLQRDGLLRDLQDLADLRDRDVHPLGDLLRGRLAAQLLHQRPRRADQLVDRLDHVHRDADRPGLVGDGAGDGLADPPRGVGRELVAALVLELVHGLHQADVALLDQVQELQPAVRVLLGDGDDQAKVGLHQLLLGLLGLPLALDHGDERALQLVGARVELVLDRVQQLALLVDLLAHELLVLVGHLVPELGVELADLVLGVAAAVHRLPHALDEPALDRLGELDAADGLRDLDAQAAQLPARPRVAGRPLGQLHELLAVAEVVPVGLGHLVRELERLADLGLQL